MTTAIPADAKLWPAIPATVAGTVALLAAYLSKRCDDRDKTAKAATEAGDRKRHEEELARADDTVANARRELATLTRRIVRQVLDAARANFFAEGEDGERYKLRATLFRCVRDAAGGKRLVLYARAGANGDSAREWAVVDDVPERCGGVAGLVWCIESTRIVVAACEWPASGDPDGRERYAASLRMSVAEAERSPTKSVCFGGTIVLVGGEKWGVLVLDSLKPGHLKDTARSGHKRILERFALLLGKILREGGA